MTDMMNQTAFDEPRLQDKDITEILVADGGETDDQSIQTLIKFLLIRGVHGATGRDGVVAGDAAQDYQEYWRAVTGETQVQFHNDYDQAMTEGGYKVVDPYLATKKGAEDAARYGAELAFPSREAVMGGIVDLANDKAYFRRVAEDIGMPIAPEQQIIALKQEDIMNMNPEREADHDKSVLDAVSKIIGRNGDNYGKTFIQANKSGGGLGNLDIAFQNGHFVSTKFEGGKPLTQEQMQYHLKNWIKMRGMEGSTDVIVAPFIPPKASHTVSMYIPDDGTEPYIFGGVFQQRLEEGTNDYMGFNWPAQDRLADDYGDEMVCAALRWAKHLQEMGNHGPTDVDYAIGDDPKTGEEVLYASESNTRWDGFNFGMRYGARVEGWDFRTLAGVTTDQIGISAHDHIVTTARSTTEVIELMQELGVPMWGMKGDNGENHDEGLVISVPPRAKSDGVTHQFGVIYVSKDPARSAMQVDRLVNMGIIAKQAV